MKQKFWHELFEAGVGLKAFNSVWEILAGSLLLSHVHGVLTRWLVSVSNATMFGYQHTAPMAHFVGNQAQHLAVDSTRIFVGAYLLFHGLVNAFMAYYLFRNRLWAYPVAVVLVSLFFIYQLYHLYHVPSWTLGLVSIFDFVFIILTWHEYQHQLVLHQHHHLRKEEKTGKSE